MCYCKNSSTYYCIIIKMYEDLDNFYVPNVSKFSQEVGHLSLVTIRIVS